MLKRDKKTKLALQNNKCLFCGRNFDYSHETPCYHTKQDAFICRPCLLFVSTFGSMVDKTGVGELDVIKLLLDYQSSHWVYKHGVMQWINETEQQEDQQ